MPFTFLSHQAVVLPLKLRAPRRFSGTALVVGSMAPDLEYFLRLRAHRTISHSVVGQFTFCLPATLFLVWVLTRVVARPLALSLPDAGAFHLRDYRVVGDKSPTPAFWIAAVFSGLIGSFSHIVWDSFTHESGWAVQRLPALSTPLFEVAGRTVLVCSVLQHASSLAGALFTIWMLYVIGRRRLLLRWAGQTGKEEPTSPGTVAALWRPVLAGAFMGVLFGLWRTLRDSGGPAIGSFWLNPFTYASSFFSAVTFGFVGLCLGCYLTERRMKTAGLW